MSDHFYRAAKIIDELQARMSNIIALWPDGPAKRYEVMVHQIAINRALYRLPMEDRLFLADGGPEFMVKRSPHV